MRSLDFQLTHLAIEMGGLVPKLWGSADLKFKKSGPGFLVKPGIYETEAEGDKRYVGTYDINRKIKSMWSY